MSADKRHNGAPVIVELPAELAEFLIETCDSNVAFALGFLQTVSRETAEKLVDQLEKYKKIKALIKDAQK